MVKTSTQNPGTNAEIRFAHCPNCEMMHRLTNERGGAIGMPGECERCGGPMDIAKARDFAEREATAFAEGSGLAAPVGS